MSAPRLRAEEARRVQAAVALALALTVPAVARALRPAPARSPAPSCGVPVVRAAEGLRCPPEEPAGPIRVGSLWLGRRLELGRADAEALTVVPGIGPRLSERIVEDRALRGPYRSVAEVERVRGVGPVLRRRLEAYVQVSSSSSISR